MKEGKDWAFPLVVPDGLEPSTLSVYCRIYTDRSSQLRYGTMCVPLLRYTSIPTYTTHKIRLYCKYIYYTRACVREGSLFPKPHIFGPIFKHGQLHGHAPIFVGAIPKVLDLPIPHKYMIDDLMPHLSPWQPCQNRGGESRTIYIAIPSPYRVRPCDIDLYGARQSRHIKHGAFLPVMVQNNNPLFGINLITPIAKGYFHAFLTSPCTASCDDPGAC